MTSIYRHYTILIPNEIPFLHFLHAHIDPKSPLKKWFLGLYIIGRSNSEFLSVFPLTGLGLRPFLLLLKALYSSGRLDGVGDVGVSVLDILKGDGPPCATGVVSTPLVR